MGLKVEQKNRVTGGAQESCPIDHAATIRPDSMDEHDAALVPITRNEPAPEQVVRLCSELDGSPRQIGRRETHGMVRRRDQDRPGQQPDRRRPRESHNRKSHNRSQTLQREVSPWGSQPEMLSMCGRRSATTGRGSEARQRLRPQVATASTPMLMYGRTIRVRTVEDASPPMTVRARG